MSTVSKYWDKYRERHRSESVEKPELAKLMTDKQAYISFLEVQLERVTQSVLTTQGFSDRIESLQTQLNSSDEKIVNLTRLVKLQQTYAEGQEEEINSLKKYFESGHEPKSPGGMQGFERRIQNLEDRVEFSRSKEKETKYEEFVKEVDAALKLTEVKITGLLSKVSEELESKQKKNQKSIEASLELCTNDLNENYKEISRKIARFKEDPDLDNKLKRLSSKVAELENRVTGQKTGYNEDFEDVKDYEERIDVCEKGLKDLEQFLVAIAEEVRKIEDRYQDTTEIEYRVSEKLNLKVERLSELVKRSLNLQPDKPKSSPVTPEKLEPEIMQKESPKFPSVVSSHHKNQQEEPRARGRAREPEVSKSRESSKSPKVHDCSKSPKSVTSRSKKSNSSSRTPKSRKSNSSSRTPKSKKSVSPAATPTHKKKNSSVSPSATPKATSKSKAMEASIKQKLKQIRGKDQEEKRQTVKREDKKKTIKKKPEKKSKLDKLYQELSGRKD